MDKKFILKLVGLTAAITILTVLYLYFNDTPEQGWFFGAIGFYFALGLLIGWRSHKAVLSKSNSTFYAGVMGGTGLRMLFCIIFLATYLTISDVKSNLLVAFYLFLYLLYTIFEISQLVSKLRAEKQIQVESTTD